MRKSNYFKNTLLGILDQRIHSDTVLFKDSNSNTVIGNKNNNSPSVIIKVNDLEFYLKVLTFGNLGLGEAYMENKFSIENGSLESFLKILLKAKLDDEIKLSLRLTLKILQTRLLGFIINQRKNVQFHYDIGHDLFESFLDSSLTYSCGYLTENNASINQLQVNKFERICQKLELAHGETLLDIGCGYGGLLIYAAKNYGIKGYGITNSQLHYEGAQKLLKINELNGKIEIRLDDYKHINRTVDKIVSVGMLEHVPRKKYNMYFEKIKNNLSRNGKGLIHCVGANSYINKHDPFIQKYIFPSSNQPKLSEIAYWLEVKKLYILDVENIIRHYSYTAQCWLDKFRENIESLRLNYPIKFLRMWEYYLACCCAAALYSDSALYQVLFMTDRANTIPLKRI